MAQVAIVGGICVGVYGIFLMLRGMVRVYKEKEMKLFWSALIFFFAAPGLVLLLLLLVKQYSIWSVLPIMILALSWIAMGYFFETYLRKERERKINGLKRLLPKPKPGQLRKDVILLSLALVIWLLGMLQVFTNDTVETCAVCICFFLLASSVTDLWKYRGF